MTNATVTAADLAKLPPLSPPPKLLLLGEARALPELGAHFLTRPLHKFWQKGDGHPVMTIPGLGADDFSMVPMRKMLRTLGYSAHPWRLGKNRGAVDIADELTARLDEMHAKQGRPVSLIGWSMGGIYARELAKARPDAVRQVITLGTPFTGHPHASNAVKMYQRLSGSIEVSPRWFELATPPPVPTTSIYSKSDGIIHWRCAINEPGHQSENIRVEGSHCGLGHHPAALFAIADRLLHCRDTWQPFAAEGIWRFLFPSQSAA